MLRYRLRESVRKPFPCPDTMNPTLHALLVQRGEWRGLSPAEKWALVYLGWTVLSALFSDYTGVWLGNGRKEGVLTIAIYVLSFLFVSHFAKVDRGRWMPFLSA